ncbi:hypothetical protein FGG08_006924 [Glutinoglossum americanum]|uniref:Vacuolar protein-sorting-associated protein 25 n=1 Tax=Glutinoglossum americanum TaxID=1670608 RepID=A0A9P8HXB3_9PEZI|nr:hypothetical protein FGG08_006924 [Glutinoglossum americanum]
MTAPLSPADQPFTFPREYHFPPFFTRQRNAITYTAQCQKWSKLILDYCRAKRIWRLPLVDAIDGELFWNKSLNRRLSLADAREIIDVMKAKEGRAEWASKDKNVALVYWRNPEEWATVIGDWVEETAQRGTVLTLYELTEGDLSASQGMCWLFFNFLGDFGRRVGTDGSVVEFHGMDAEVLQKSLNVLVKRGKAQVFGNEDQQGVKFF